MVCINNVNINEFHSYSKHQFKNLRHHLSRNYQPLIPTIPDYSVKLLFPDHKCNI